MSNQSNQSNANKRVVLMCTGLAAGMLGLSYAAVPLYTIFCQVTGFGGTTQRAEAPMDAPINRTMKVRFDANVQSALNWDFEPAQRQVEIKVGKQKLAFYRAQNNSKRQITGTATFNVSPPQAGAYFSKVECFCFTEQTLNPGQSVDMPVSFFIDPDIENDVDLRALKTITLSYTFYHVDEPERTSAVRSKATEETILN